MTIVVGYVPTPEGRAAVEEAIAEGRRRGLALVIVHSHVGGDQLEQGRGAQYETDLEHLRTGLDELAVDAEVIQFARGADPAADILRVAEERAAVVIVMGLRKRSTVGKLFLGSTATRILQGARCPVLAVPARTPAPH